MSEYSASINKYGERLYRVFYSYSDVKGKRHRTCKRGFGSYKTAKEWMQSDLPLLIPKLIQGNSPKIITDANMTMAELVERYLSHFRSDDDNKETSYENKVNIINTKILKSVDESITPLGDMIVHEITPDDILTWQDTLKKYRQKNGKAYAKSYLRTVENQLSAIFNFAVKYHNLPKNPIVDRICGKPKRSKTKYWQLSQYYKFIEEAQYRPEYYYAFQVFFWCGLRTGELLALTPADLDLERGIISVRKNYQVVKGKQLITSPKTEFSNRDVYMPDFLTEELKEYMNSIYGLAPNQRVFPLSKSRIKSFKDKCCSKINMEPITVHGLRHSHASMLATMGISLQFIGERLGHKSDDEGKNKITENYAHIYNKKQRRIATILDEIHDGKISIDEDFVGLHPNIGLIEDKEDLDV